VFLAGFFKVWKGFEGDNVVRIILQLVLHLHVGTGELYPVVTPVDAAAMVSLIRSSVIGR
jgi:hypothetical protein